MKNHTKIFIGTSGWSYKHWKNLFYPKNIASKNWLNYYSSIFDTVELNATFYRRFSPQAYQHWYEATPKNFHFVVKISAYITHRKYLIDVSQFIKNEEKSAENLQDKFSLFLLQLPPRIAYAPERLRQALSAFKKPQQVVVELRNAKWFTEEIKDLLKEYKAIFCNLDSPSFHITDWLTSPTAYIRLHGHDHIYDHNYTTRELMKIADNVKSLLDRGAKKVFIIFNNDVHAYAPKNAEKLKSILNL